MVVSFYRGEEGKGWWYAGQANGLQKILIRTRNQWAAVFDDDGYIRLEYPKEAQHGPSTEKHNEAFRKLNNLYAGLCESAADLKKDGRRIIVSAEVLEKMGEVLEEYGADYS